MEDKVKLVLDETVTSALADIQDPMNYENYKAALEDVNEFIFSHSDFDKTTVVCLSAIHDMQKLLGQLSGRSHR